MVGSETSIKDTVGDVSQIGLSGFPFKKEIRVRVNPKADSVNSLKIK